MPQELKLSWVGIETYLNEVARKICQVNWHNKTQIWAYPVPNGGIPALLMLIPRCKYWGDLTIEIAGTPGMAQFLFDDIIDSGKTRERYPHQYFFAVINKLQDHKELAGTWVTFPWESAAKEHPSGPEDAVRRLIQHIGDDPNREGLRETPGRVIKAHKELFSGYHQDPAALMKVFEEGACDEMILVKDINFTSFCEHHMLQFDGVAHVAYIPDGRIVGLSKIARLVDVYAKRLQVQERLTVQVANALMEHLKPKGAACVIDAVHSCMRCRGVRKPNAVMRTSSVQGVFREKPEVRSEFFALIRG